MLSIRPRALRAGTVACLAAVSCAMGVATAASGQCTVIPQGPFDDLVIELSPNHYWNFNEETGDAHDHGAFYVNLHGDWGRLASRLRETSRTDAVGASARFINGLSGQASRVIRIPHGPSMSTPEATVVLIVRPDAGLNPGATILSKTLGGADLDLALAPLPDARGDLVNALRLRYDGRAVEPTGAARAIDAGEWHVVAVRLAADGVALWADGVQIAEDAAPTAGLVGFTGDWVLGANTDLTDVYGGLIDDMMLFDRALSDAELERIHRCAILGDCAAPDANGPCSPADITTDGGCAFGEPDGAVTLSDFGCYLSTWASLEPGADLTTHGFMNGVPDAAITLSDFSYYLAVWAEGCP